MKFKVSYSSLRMIPFLGGCALIFALWYFGFAQSDTSSLPLIVSNSQVLIAHKDSFSMTIEGSKFPTNIQAVLTPNVDNKQAVIATLPLAGYFNDSVLHNDVLYLATNDRGLYAIDVSNPQRPRLLGEYLTDQAVTALLIVDDVLIAGGGKTGLTFFKIIDADHLETLSSFKLSHPVVKLCYSHGFLFVAMGQQGLVCFDIRNVYHPLMAPSVLGYFISDIGIIDDYLVVFSKRQRSVITYSIDSAGHLAEIDRVVRTESAISSSFSHEGFYTASRAGLAGFRVNNNGHIEPIFEKPLINTVEKLFSGKSGLYLFKNFSAISCFNLNSFEGTSNYFLSDKITTLEEAGDYLFVTGRNKGLRVFNRHSLTSAQVAKLYEIPYPVNDLFLDKRNVYVALGTQGAYYIEKSDPKQKLRSLSVSPSTSFASSGNLLFVTQGSDGIEIFDTSAPDPVELTRWPHITASHLAVWQHFAISSRGIYGIECIDFNNLSEPVVTARLPDLHALAMVFDRGFLFVATKENGLLIFSVSEQGELNLKSHLTLPFPMSQFAMAIDVQVKNGFAYIANGRSGLMIADVRDPVNSKIVSSLGLSGGSKGILLQDSLALILNDTDGIDLVNIEDAHKPFVVGKMELPSLARYPVLGDGLLYLPRTKGSILTLPLPHVSDHIKIYSGKAVIGFSGISNVGHYDLNISAGSHLIVVKDAVVVKN